MMVHNKRKCAFAFLLACLMLNGCDSQRQDYNSAIALLLKGDPATGLQELVSLAKKGYAPAQLRLGVLYGNGILIRADSRKAAQLVLTAALGGDSSAEYFIAELYRSGKWVDKRPGQALAWFQRAAKQGFVPAQFSAGMLYAEKNRHREAKYWMHVAARNGHKKSMLTLAQWYQEGLYGLPQDPEKSDQWRRNTLPRKDWQ